VFTFDLFATLPVRTAHGDPVRILREHAAEGAQVVAVPGRLEDQGESAILFFR
jgi:hypothetical protein